MSIYKGTDLVAGMPSYGDIIDTLYPVGSVYIGTTSTCPLAAIKGTWTLKSSGIVTSVDTNVPVKGNGTALGLTDNHINAGLVGSSSGMTYGSNNYGSAVGSSFSGSSTFGNKAVGITTDATKSGIEGTVTRSVYTVNIWERTA